MATSNCADALSLIFSPSFSSNTASKLPHIRKFSQTNLCLHYHNTLSSVLRNKNAIAACVSATMASK
ncbi:hypothetical protein CICLE_v10033275mg [Citrus x clementina]|uniref:Uncharacterized protein n=1 Tax=Citrus clementina TaxID=85681 RepID=V4SNN0_CITCL|nr:hypothetical protein CICLE_v10033275mg [Citrus x clementina]